MTPLSQWPYTMGAVRRSNTCLKAAFSTSARAFHSSADPPAAKLLSIVDKSFRSNDPLNLSAAQGVASSKKNNSADSAKPSILGNRVVSLIQDAHARKRRANANVEMKSSTAQEFRMANLSRDLTKQITRMWKAGDVYGPNDLSPYEMSKWKQRRRPEHDVFDLLDVNPLDEYKNFSIMSEFVTPMGRIKHSSETGLRPLSQRRISKAIRRSVGLGLMPSSYHHPEILQRQATRAKEMLNRDRTSTWI